PPRIVARLCKGDAEGTRRSPGPLGVLLSLRKRSNSSPGRHFWARSRASPRPCASPGEMPYAPGGILDLLECCFMFGEETLLQDFSYGREAISHAPMRSSGEMP